MTWFSFSPSNGKPALSGVTSVCEAIPATYEGVVYTDPTAFLRAVYGDPNATVTFSNTPPSVSVPAYHAVTWVNTAVTPNTSHTFTVTPVFLKFIRETVLTAQALNNSTMTFPITDNTGSVTNLTLAQLQTLFATTYAAKS